MSRTAVLPVVFVLCLSSLALVESHAGESPADKRVGWSRVEAVPAWVGAPPVREGHFRFVDGAQSNRLGLVYPDIETDLARRNVRLLLLARLAALPGVDARAVSETAAASAKATEQVFLFRPAKRGTEAALGATLYTAFVLWDVPSGPLLDAVPATMRSSVEAALSAPPSGSGMPWKALPAKPRWAVEKPTSEGRFLAVTTRASGAWPAVLALADLRGGSAVRSEVQGRLRPVLGNNLAFEVGVMVSGRAQLLERACFRRGAEAWQRWRLSFEDVLSFVPMSHRARAHSALAAPAPPRPWNWVDAVTIEPTWVAKPSAWPAHVAVVQRRHADTPQVARTLSARRGAQDVAAALAARLEPVVGQVTARRAADAGASQRHLVRRAIRDVPAAASAGGEPRERQVTVWTLWEVPLDAVLQALPRARWEAVRAALTQR